MPAKSSSMAAPITRVPVHRRNIGMLFQNYALFPHMTCRAEHRVRPGDARHRRARRCDGARRRGVATGAACRLRATACRRSFPAASSSASRWRAPWSSSRRCCCSTSRSARSTRACARACRSNCARCSAGSAITTVLVTHDQDEALTMADRIVIMRDGRIEQVGAPAEVYQRPVSRFIAELSRRGEFLSRPGDERVATASAVAVPHGPMFTVPSRGRSAAM